MVGDLMETGTDGLYAARAFSHKVIEVNGRLTQRIFQAIWGTGTLCLGTPETEDAP